MSDKDFAMLAIAIMGAIMCLMTIAQCVSRTEDGNRFKEILTYRSSTQDVK